ncbi:hypothetical protein GCM10009624_30180 [Gordonia sinesedis]
MRAQAPFYLYLVSKAELDFSACGSAPIILEDGYSIVGNRKYGPNVDLRCYIDPGPYMRAAVGAVYSSSMPANLNAALEFCREVGGYDFN